MLYATEEEIKSMINEEALNKIDELSKLYKFNWGKEVDRVGMPLGMSQEKLVIVIERIVETGESILVGWNKCFLNKKEDRRI